ncbi:MAG: preprotein translocase subunit SecA, partial [Chloroflexia bacterium]|nr:preprotein translocase subunit SecA [Chloroflexia bacterium]
MRSFFTRLLGDSNDKEIREFNPIVEEVNGLEAQFEGFSQDDLRQLMAEIRDDYKEESDLDDYLPQVFAATREAAKRTNGQRHFDVQLMGGVALHEGKISEMKTGEGKTLTATLAVSLNALSGR